MLMTFDGWGGPSALPMAAGGTLVWRSDGSVQKAGFEICMDVAVATEATVPAPTSDSSAWKILSGDCRLSNGGTCITDAGGASSDYGPNEACMVEAGMAMTVTSTSFDTEEDYDKIEIQAADGMLMTFDGWGGPSALPMAASGTLVWRSDGSVQKAGFEICMDVAGATEATAEATEATAEATEATGAVVPAPTSESAAVAAYEQQWPTCQFALATGRKLENKLFPEVGNDQASWRDDDHKHGRQLRMGGCMKYKNSGMRNSRAPPPRPRG